MGYIVKLHRQTNNQQPTKNTLLTILATRISEDNEIRAKTLANSLAEQIIDLHPSRINAPNYQSFSWQQEGVRTQSPYCLIKCWSDKTNEHNTYFLLDLIHENLQHKVKNKAKHEFSLRYHARLHYSTPFTMKPHHKDFYWYSQSFEEAQDLSLIHI